MILATGGGSQLSLDQTSLKGFADYSSLWEAVLENSGMVNSSELNSLLFAYKGTRDRG